LKKWPSVCSEGNFITAVEAYFTDEGAIGLQFGQSVTAGFVYFVVAIPAELDRIMIAAAGDRAGHAAEGGLAASGLEQNVGRPHHVGIVIGVVRHLHDAPPAKNDHTRAARSLGSRTKL
jgi:hypothetical protein